MKRVWLTKKERVNAKHKCIRWKLVEKSLVRLILCSSSLIRSAGYTCSCLTITLLSSSLFSTFHLEGLGLFSLILVPSKLHWKASTPSYEQCWHCSGVIFSLIRQAKWVQIIECRVNGCFTCTISFFACRQIFLLFLGLCPIVFRTGLRPFWGHKSILGVLGHYSLPRLVMRCLYFPKGALSMPSEVCFLTLDFSLLTLSSNSRPPT